MGIDLRYEKLYVTCFLCGIIRHIEDQCVHFRGKNDDDLSKPYGWWFQNDVLGDNYRRTLGKRFRPNRSQGWSMKAPLHVEEVESSINDEL